ncbi:transposase [Escherichia coli]|uniref:Uncharacterized protein n=1 Tax=Escherichia coli TaxID=562 RepID=A0A5B9SY32_ECOLX|nr:hypothetical protein EC0638J-ColB-ColM_00137 [Escherichia coli]QEG96023.1 hypothetical protein EC0315J-ColB-ColM_00086 [Escherichia coli]GCO35895.1 transposase [Escherichia coli]GDS86375.1 transposase [Escherichia coli]
MLKPMDPPPEMVAASIQERRGDTAALTLLQDVGVNPSSSNRILFQTIMPQGKYSFASYFLTFSSNESEADGSGSFCTELSDTIRVCSTVAKRKM